MLSIPARGYYIEQPDTIPLLIRKNAPAAKKQTAFAIQDNLNLFADLAQPAPYLLPVSNHFIAADVINSNLPIFSLFRSPTTREGDVFANFLYANLRIKKILEDYADIQKRAMTLLGSSLKPGNTYLTANSANYRPKSSEHKPSENEAASLARDLRRLQQHLSGIKQPGPYDGNYRPQSSLAAAGIHTITSLHELQDALQPRPGKKIIQAPRSTTTDAYSPILNGYLLNSGAVQDNPTSPQTRESMSQHTGEVELPWILMQIRKLFLFLFTHKIAVLATGFILLVFIKILSTPRY